MTKAQEFYLKKSREYYPSPIGDLRLKNAADQMSKEEVEEILPEVQQCSVTLRPSQCELLNEKVKLVQILQARLESLKK